MIYTSALWWMSFVYSQEYVLIRLYQSTVYVADEIFLPSRESIVACERFKGWNNKYLEIFTKYIVSSKLNLL